MPPDEPHPAPDDPRETARDLRSALASYVRAVHEAWLDTVRTAAVDVADLPLGGRPFEVAVAAGEDLHVVATRDPLPAVAEHEQVVEDEVDGVSWRVRFLDATVVPELAATAGADGTAVTDVLGVHETLYHLVVRPDGALSPHQATHAGSGLARSHLVAGGRS